MFNLKETNKMNVEEINVKDAGLGAAVTTLVVAIGFGIKKVVTRKKDCRRKELKEKIRVNQETIRSKNWMSKEVKNATHQQFELVEEWLKL